MSLIVYVAGYGAGKNGKPTHPVTRLQEVAEMLNALILDVRSQPYSRYPDYCIGALTDRLRERYAHISHWGNVNYRPADRDKGIEIVNWWEGLRQFKILMAMRLPDGERRASAVILLCACRAEVECHRMELGSRLKAEGYAVKSLPWLEITKEGKPVKKKQGALSL